MASDASFTEEDVPDVASDQHIFPEITKEVVEKVLSSTSAYKASGPDGVSPSTLKLTTSLHERLAVALDRVVREEEGEIPKWLCEGRAVMIQKDTKQPASADNLRPINCLNAIYKVLTKVLESSLRQHIEPLLEPQQRGARAGIAGAQEILLTDRIICEELTERKGSFSMAWIDMKKAFDSVAHNWISANLERLKTDPMILNFLTRLMPQWSSKLYYIGKPISEEIQIKRGIFQGD